MAVGPRQPSEGRGSSSQKWLQANMVQGHKKPKSALAQPDMTSLMIKTTEDKDEAEKVEAAENMTDGIKTKPQTGVKT